MHNSIGLGHGSMDMQGLGELGAPGREAGRTHVGWRYSSTRVRYLPYLATLSVGGMVRWRE
jgi:hypothetical protein